MGTFFLGIYIALIFVRPMDWWEPLRGFELVTAASIMTILAAFQRILNLFQLLWRLVPELRIAACLLVCVTLSWGVYPFSLTGMQRAFTDFGKLIVLYFLIILLARQPR